MSNIQLNINPAQIAFSAGVGGLAAVSLNPPLAMVTGLIYGAFSGVFFHLLDDNFQGMTQCDKIIRVVAAIFLAAVIASALTNLVTYTITFIPALTISILIFVATKIFEFLADSAIRCGNK